MDNNEVYEKCKLFIIDVIDARMKHDVSIATIDINRKYKVARNLVESYDKMVWYKHCILGLVKDDLFYQENYDYYKKMYIIEKDFFINYRSIVCKWI